MLLQTQQLPNKIFDYIVQEIITGKLAQGSRIRESDYSTLFSVSRSPVREALYRLEQEGLAVKRPRKGSFVRVFSANDVYDLFDIRNTLEQMALSRIEGTTLSEQSLQAIHTTLEQMNTADTHDTYTRLNFQFHYHLIELSNSMVLTDYYLKLKFPLLLFQNLNFSVYNQMEISMQEHEHMLHLLVNKEMNTLRELLKQHNNRAMDSLSSYFKQNIKNRSDSI